MNRVNASDIAVTMHRPSRNWKVIVAALVLLAALAAVLIRKLLPLTVIHNQVLLAESHEEAPGSYAIRRGGTKLFRFDGRSNRVLVADTPAFHFGSNQDFSVEAWIKAYPNSSRLAQKLQPWLLAHPATGRLIPHWVVQWIGSKALDNDFGVVPIVDKHHTPETVESIGFEFYLDHGKLACQLSQAPMQPLHFQNFVSPAPLVQDGHWHYVAMTVKRASPVGGKLYVDGRQVLVFDPTAQEGDLANSEPLRIGNHANPNLRCFFKGLITGVALHRRPLAADEIISRFRSGKP